MSKLKKSFSIILLLLLITPLLPAKAYKSTQIESFLVKSENTALTEADFESLGIDEFKKIDGLNIYEIETSQENINLLLSKDSIKVVERNNIVKISQIPNDPYFIYQNYLSSSNIINAWDVSVGSPSITVAVIDTGVDYYHEDLKNRVWTNSNGYHGYDFVNSDNDPMDDNGHGTMIAGVIAAEKNNGVGIAGIANIKIMAIKAVPQNGEGDVADLARGIVYAADNGARVANVSLGLAEESIVLDDAINYARIKGCLIVAATGNMYRSFIDNPARNPYAIGVTALNGNEIRASYANYGSGTSVTAAGNNIYSTSWNKFNNLNLYEYSNGTSFATPQVTATAALLIAKDPSLNSDQIKKRILSSAKKIPAMLGKNYSEEYGYGKLDAFNALKYDILPPEGSLKIYLSNYGLYNIKGQITDSKGISGILPDITESNVGLVRYQIDKIESWTTLNTNSISILNIDFNLPPLSQGNHTINFEISDTAGNKKTLLLNTSDAISSPNSINLSDYKYELISQSPYVNTSPGQTTNISLVFKNIGNTVWNKNIVHLGTTHPMDKPSIFSDASWLSNNRISMQEDLVPIGGLAHFNFTITTPNGVYGSSNEYFCLVAEGIGWLKDIGIFWKVNITPPSYHALFINQSPYLTMSPREEKLFWVEFQNIGTATWNNRNVSLGTNKPQDRDSPFYNGPLGTAGIGWKSANRIAMSQNEVKPGEVARFNFTAKAPSNTGIYFENFRPVADGITWMEDYGLFWKIVVQ